MPNSYTQIETPSTRGPHAFTFDFLDVDDIKAKGLNQQDEWNELSIESIDKTAKTIILDNTASGLQALRIYRSTTNEELVDFVAGARIREQDLDMAYKQGLFACQEVTEDAQAIGTRITAASFADATVDTDALVDDAVTSVKIADNAVANNHLATDAVGGDELQDGSVTAAKLYNILDLSSKTVTLPASAVTPHVSGGAVKNVSNVLIEPIDLNTTNLADRIPADNTLPQITEGLRVKQVTYSPAATSSVIHIDAYFTIGEPVNGSNQFTSALFINDTCVNVMARNGASNVASLHRLQAIYTNTTGASIDIEIRADGYRTIINGKTLGSSAGSLQTSGSSCFGGSDSVNGSFMNITEY